MDTLSTKTRALLLRPLKTTKVTKMAGVTHAKTLFAKNPVFALLIKGCLAALPGNRPKSAFFALLLSFFLPFSGRCEEHLGEKAEEKGLFPQISSDLLKPPSLKPLFAALQKEGGGKPHEGEPSQKGVFGPPLPRLVRFPTLSGVIPLCLLCKNPQLSRAELSGTKIASQDRSDHCGRKRARNHSAAEIAGFFASPAAKKTLAASDFGLSLKIAGSSQRPRNTKEQKLFWFSGTFTSPHTFCTTHIMAPFKTQTDI